MAGATYYVSTTGDDLNDGSLAHPKKTLNAGVNLLSGGDTLKVFPGTYFERLNNNTIPSGVTPYSTGATVIQKLGLASDPNPEMRGNLWISVKSNILWDGININGIDNGTPTADFLAMEHFTNVMLNGGTSIHIINCEVFNAQIHNFMVGDGNGPLSDILLKNLKVHDAGKGGYTDSTHVPGNHNFYISAHYTKTSNIVLDGIESYNALGPGPNSWGIQVYSTDPGYLDNVIIRNCFVHDNNQGIVIGSGNNHQVYNNIVYNNDSAGSYGEAGITVGYGNCDNILIANNTIVGNSHNGAYAISVGVFGDCSNTQILNNIMWQNGHDSVNLGNNTDTVQIGNWATDPQFVSPGVDFHLQSGSPAHSTAQNLSTIFTTDKGGIIRPTLSAWTPGAYEAGSGAEPTSGGGNGTGGGDTGPGSGPSGSPSSGGAGSGGVGGGGTGTTGGPPAPTLDPGKFWIAVRGDFMTSDDLTQHECVFAPVPFAPKIAYGFLAKGKFMAIIGPNTVVISEETVAGNGIYQAWALVTTPTGPWAEVSFDQSNVAFYLTRPGGDTTLAVQYTLNVPPITDQAMVAVTVTTGAVKGKVKRWASVPSSGSGRAKLLEVGSTNKIASTQESQPGATDPFVTWNKEYTLPVTKEFACWVDNKSPYSFSDGDALIMLPKNDTTYVYNTDQTTWRTATCPSGDWRDVACFTAGGSSGKGNRFMAVGAGTNKVAWLADLAGAPSTWTLPTVPAGWNNVDPRILFISQGVADAGADGAFILLSGGIGNQQVLYTDLTSGVLTALAAMPGIPVISGAIWTGLDVNWGGGFSHGSHVIIVGTIDGIPAMLVSNDMFTSPFTITSWTQKTFSGAPF